MCVFSESHVLKRPCTHTRMHCRRTVCVCVCFIFVSTVQALLSALRDTAQGDDDQFNRILAVRLLTQLMPMMPPDMSSDLLTNVTAVGMDTVSRLANATLQTEGIELDDMELVSNMQLVLAMYKAPSHHHTVPANPYRPSLDVVTALLLTVLQQSLADPSTTSVPLGITTLEFIHQLVDLEPTAFISFQAPLTSLHTHEGFHPALKKACDDVLLKFSSIVVPIEARVPFAVAAWQTGRMGMKKLRALQASPVPLVLFSTRTPVPRAESAGAATPVPRTESGMSSPIPRVEGMASPVSRPESGLRSPGPRVEGISSPAPSIDREGFSSLMPSASPVPTPSDLEHDTEQIALIRQEWDQQEAMASMALELLRLPRTQGRLFPTPIVGPGVYFCCDSDLPHTIDLALRLPLEATMVSLTVNIPHLEGVPNGATTVPVVVDEKTAPITPKLPDTSPPGHLDQYSVHRLQQLRKGKGAHTVEPVELKNDWPSLALQRLGVPPGFGLATQEVESVANMHSLDHISQHDAASPVAVDFSDGFLSKNPSPLPPMTLYESKHVAVTTFANSTMNRPVSIPHAMSVFTSPIPLTYFGAPSELRTTSAQLDLHVQSKLTLQIFRTRTANFHNLSRDENATLNVKSHWILVDVVVTDIRAALQTTTLAPMALAGSQHDETVDDLAVGTTLILQMASREKPLQRFDATLVVTHTQDMFDTLRSMRETWATFPYSIPSSHSTRDQRVFYPPVNLPPFPRGYTFDGTPVYHPPCLALPSPSHVSWRQSADISDMAGLVPVAVWTSTDSAATTESVCGYVRAFLPCL
jgi:hypothetical protein